MRLPWIIGLTLIAAGVVSGCATTGEGTYTPPSALSEEQEMAIGAQLSQEVEKTEKVLDDASIQKYIGEIGDRLARVSPRQNVEYRFTVIEKDELNAFALPGGHMYIYTGLLKLCQNEAELASVMGHEIAHVAAEHHGESIARQQQLELLIAAANAALEGKPIGQAGAQIIGGMATLKFSRDQEREADKLGMDVLFRAGYNPDAMVSFMSRMLEQEQSGGGSMPFALLSSHPLTQNRIVLLQQLAAQFPADMKTQGTLGEERYRQTVLNRFK
ncbi:MAG: hypothetical protein AMXMBFR84_36670 [Candidatus Hydrogenedentota bacterium]